VDVLVLLDEHPDSINDGGYIAVLNGYGGLYGWCDIPATDHHGACDDIDWVKDRMADPK
jgi:hypothetical protein